MPRKPRYIGAYRDEKDRIRPITPRKGRQGKYGVPMRARKRISNVEEERSRIDVVEPMPRRRLPPGPLSRQELRDIHASRTMRSQTTDDRLFAKPAKTQKEWLAQMNRRDIRGIDEFPLKVQRDFRKHFPEYINDMERYYDTEVGEFTTYEVHKKHATFNKKYGRRGASQKGVLGFVRNHKDGTGEVHLGPETTKVLAQGEIRKAGDLIYFQSIFHEVGHRMGPSGHSQGYAGVCEPKKYFNTGFDEGANEILSQRFVLNNIRMPIHVRRLLTGTKTFNERFYEESSTYKYDQRIVAKAALIAANGDEKKAVKWIEDMRYAPDDAAAREARSQFVDEVVKARKQAPADFGDTRMMILPKDRPEASSLLRWREGGSRSTENTLDHIIEAKGIRDPYKDPPKRYRYTHIEYEYEFVKVKDIKKKGRVVGEKFEARKTGKIKSKETKAIPWWLVA